MKSLLATSRSFGPTILRIVLGAVMFPHGAQKVLGLWGGHGFSATLAGMSHQYPAFLVVLAMMAEFLGSLGLLLGFLTRIAAFGVLCNMLVAIASVHAKNGFFMNWTGAQAGEGFEYHLLVLAICVYLIVSGGGRWSVDGGIARSAKQVDRVA